jgi:hypothetical protein
MSNSVQSKKRSVINYLASGRSLTQERAYRLFGVRNLRATISDVREQVEKYGNWRIVRGESRAGDSTYSMKRIQLVDPANFTVGGRRRSKRTSR